MVKFDNFKLLGPESADLARELIDATERQRSAFASFMTVWMGFNGWLECVTEAQTDRAMIMAISSNTKCASVYGGLLAGHADFRTAVKDFSAMWPVLNVRDVRAKLGPDAFNQFSRQDLLMEVLGKDVKHEPAGWIHNQMPTWPQLIRTIYSVRCNLFHGAKSPQNRRDHELVVTSDRILRRFIELSGCLDWRDH